MILVDTHAHLYAEEFNADRSEMIERALADGVKKMFLPNIDSTSLKGMLDLCEEYPESCYATMGLHPCSVKENFMEELALVETELKKGKYCGVGETGIDLYWDKTFFEQQKKSFAIQIQWALDFNLPLIIHTRNSFNETLEVISSFEKKPKGIFHCFGGTIEDAEKIISLGTFKMGIGGVVTYKNSTLPEVLKQIDLKHLVLETDAPYLPPVPFRGKRNESSYVKLVAQKLAEIKNISLEEVADITTKNAFEIFGEH
jgi:TatD DNase family protein